jgi:hypothetical protein
MYGLDLLRQPVQGAHRAQADCGVIGVDYYLDVDRIHGVSIG